MFSAELLNKIIMFCLTIIFARYLGVQKYGEFSFALSFSGLFFIISDCGLSTLIVKKVSRNKNITEKYLKYTATIKLILSVVTLLLLYGTLILIDKSSNIQLMVLLLGIYIILNSINEFLSSFFRAYERMQFIAISILIRGLILLFIGLFSVYFDLGIYFIILSYILGSLFSFIYLRVSLKKIGSFLWFFDYNFTLRLLKQSFPFALSVVFASIYLSIDSIIISHYIGDFQLGYYSLGYSLTIVFYLIPSILSNVYLPQFSILYKSSFSELNSLFNSLLFKLIVISIPLVIFLYFIAPYMIPLLYGENYSKSIYVFQVLLMALFFKFFSFPYAFLLIATEKQNIRLKIQGLTALINIVLNILIIPKYGIIGAAYTTVFSEFVLLILYYLSSKK